jgi:cytoskeletal protein CcmA (bactofilin family)
MFKDSARGDLNGFLDAGSLINGELHFEDTFRVDGKLTGKVVSDGDLVIGEQGEVDGEVTVGRVFVSGVVRGSVKATRRVELTAGGKAYADLDTPCLVIEEGAVFEGKCRMTAETSKVRRLPVGQEKIKP